MTQVLTEIETRVARGAALLDDVKPGWAQDVDLEVFDILDPCRCTLGQLFEWYSAGCSYLGFTSSDPERYQLGAHQHGFFENALENEDYDAYSRQLRWAELDKTWYALIQERQAAA